MRFAALGLTALLALPAQAKPRGPTSAKPASSARPKSVQPRERGYKAQHYRIELGLDVKTGAFTVKTTVSLVPTRRLRAIEFDLERQQVDKAALKTGEPLAIARGRTGLEPEDDLLILKPRAPLPAGKLVELVIESRGQAGSDQNGLFRALDPARPSSAPLFVTQLAPTGARRVFPCDDQPAGKATTETLVTVDDSYRVFSNGKLVEDVPAGDGLRRVHWSQEQPHSTYLVAIVAGQLETVASAKSKVPLAVHSAAGTGPQALFSLDALEKVVPFFEEYLGVPYPWARLDIAAIPLFIYGGMENTSLIFDNDSTVGTLDLATPGVQAAPFGLVAHEAAHQWFGDLVTMRWWDDVWLNESLATFLGGLASERLLGDDERVGTVAGLTRYYFPQEDGPRSHPIRSSVLSRPQDGYDGINYTKGAAVLRTVQVLIGEDAFRRGLHAYLVAHAHGSASSSDLIDAFSRASGQDLKTFGDAWLKQRGYPIFSSKWTWDRRRGVARLEVRQRSNHKGEQAVFPVKLPVALRRRTAPAFDVAVAMALPGRHAVLEVPLPAEPEWASWNAGAQVLGKVAANNGESERLRLIKGDPDAPTRMAALLVAVAPLLDRGRRTQPALSAALTAQLASTLAEDPSLAVRAALLEALSTSRFLIPAALEAPALQLAQLHAKPTSREQYRARNAAWALLGAAQSKAGAGLARAAAVDPQADRGTLEAALRALALAKDVASLEQSLQVQRGRGYAFRRVAFSAFPRVRDAAVVASLDKLLADASGNDELVGALFTGLRDNPEVSTSQAGAAFLARIALDPTVATSDEWRARAVQTLSDFRTAAALQQLNRIARESQSARLSENAALLGARLAAQGTR